jgi:hypothetical protein
MPRFQSHSIVERPDDNAVCYSPGGYVIEHVFQMQDDEETNNGQYTETAQVEDWTELAFALDHMLTYPHTAGFTVSVTITAINGRDWDDWDGSQPSGATFNGSPVSAAELAALSETD